MVITPSMTYGTLPRRVCIGMRRSRYPAQRVQPRRLRNPGRHVIDLQGPLRGLACQGRRRSDGCWTLNTCNDFGQRWIAHHDDLLKAVVLLGEMLGVEWADG